MEIKLVSLFSKIKVSIFDAFIYSCLHAHNLKYLTYVSALFLDIRALASKLVEQWLKTVKGEQVVPIDVSDIPKIMSDAHNLINEAVKTEISNVNNLETKIDIDEQIQTIDVKNEPEIKIEKLSLHYKDEIDKKDTLPVLKIRLKDGKKVISQIDDSDKKSQDGSETEGKEHHKSRSKEKSRERSSSSKSSSSSKHSSKSNSLSNDKHRSSHKNSSSSSSRRSSKDGTREKDKHSSRSKSDSKSKKASDRTSSSSSKSKDERSKSSVDKDKNKEKDRDEKNSSQKTNEKSTEDKPQSPSIHKLGKIPKLSDVKKEKPSISIEVRKPDEPKPKTVKTYNSRFRKHGLEEEVKPPPSRATVLNKKPLPALPSSIPLPKRPSPVHNESPPEKKPKILESIEKPGAIKLIPPKPKREYMSFIYNFYDRLTYSIFFRFVSPPSVRFFECTQ